MTAKEIALACLFLYAGQALAAPGHGMAKCMHDKTEYKPKATVQLPCAGMAGVTYTVICTEAGSWLEHTPCSKPGPAYQGKNEVPPLSAEKGVHSGPHYVPEHVGDIVAPLSQKKPTVPQFKPIPSEFIPPVPSLPKQIIPSLPSLLEPIPTAPQIIPPLSHKKPKPSIKPVGPIKKPHCEYMPGYMPDNFDIYKFQLGQSLKFFCPGGQQQQFDAICDSSGHWIMKPDTCAVTGQETSVLPPPGVQLPPGLQGAVYVGSPTSGAQGPSGGAYPDSQGPVYVGSPLPDMQMTNGESYPGSQQPVLVEPPQTGYPSSGSQQPVFVGQTSGESYPGLQQPVMVEPPQTGYPSSGSQQPVLVGQTSGESYPGSQQPVMVGPPQAVDSNTDLQQPVFVGPGSGLPVDATYGGQP